MSERVCCKGKQAHDAFLQYNIPLFVVMCCYSIVKYTNRANQQANDLALVSVVFKVGDNKRSARYNPLN